jgi:hypothetical protein
MTAQAQVGAALAFADPELLSIVEVALEKMVTRVRDHLVSYTCGRLRRKTLYSASPLTAPSAAQVIGLSTR